MLEQLIKASGIGRSITSSMTLDSNSNTVARKSAHAATLLEMGMADAVLFGHIAEALCHDKLSVIIQEYDLIMTYFGDICQRFFAVSYSTADDDSEGVPKTWKVLVQYNTARFALFLSIVFIHTFLYAFPPSLSLPPFLVTTYYLFVNRIVSLTLR